MCRILNNNFVYCTKWFKFFRCKKKKKNTLRNLADVADVETEDDEVVSSTCEKRPGDSQYTAAGFDY